MIPRLITERTPELRERATDAEALAATLAQSRRDVALARARLVEGTCEQDVLILARELKLLGRALRLSGLPDEAIAPLGEAHALFAAHGRVRAAFLCRLHQSGALAEKGELDAALAEHAALLGDADAPDLRLYRPFVLESRAAVHLAAGDLPSTRRDLRDAIALHREVGAHAPADALAAISSSLLASAPAPHRVPPPP